MFQGFTDETFEFLMAIAFNNNTEFFHANHDWYLRALRQPCLALAEALSDAVEAVDGQLERRPNRVVSRINRDLRYARDKSPYRDCLWLSFHRPAEIRYTAPSLYFEITARGASCGMGFYEADRARMNGLRRRLLREPEVFLELLRPLKDYQLFIDAFKRMKLPEALHPELKGWYPVRTFYLNRDIDDFDLIKSPELATAIALDYARFAPLCRYFSEIEPVPDEDRTRQAAPEDRTTEP